jgi:hypothetical protein
MLFLSILFMVGGTSIAQTPELKSLTAEIIEKNHGSQYQIGDRIQLSAVLPYELSNRIKTIKLKPEEDPNGPDASGFFIDPSPQVISGNLRYSVTPLKSGKLNLPPLLLFLDESNPVAKIQPLSFDVAELTQAKQEPQLLDPVGVSIPPHIILMIIVVILVLIALGIYIYHRFIKKKPASAPMVEVSIPPVPDHEIAHRDINSLYERYPYSPENLKPVAFGISQVLKNYFSSRFKIDARESTTIEMINLLRSESIPDHELKRIIDLYKKLDQIKFTDYEHHSYFLKGDFLEFKDIAKSIIDTWTIRGGTK